MGGVVEYGDFQHIPVVLGGEPATLVTRPGVWHWEGVNPGTAALVEAMAVRATDAVLDLGCGTGLIGLAAARAAPQGRVTLVDVNVVAVECARRTLAANGAANAEVRLCDGPERVEGYDLVLSHLPRGRAVIEELVAAVARALKPGGRFYLVAHKRAGVRGAIACAARLLGEAHVVRQKAGYHVALAVKRRPAPPPRSTWRAFSLTLDGLPTTLVSKPGVFAWDRLDAGTAALVEAMEIGAGEQVLDLGCGTGLLSVAAARRGGEVTAVDADLRAVESTRRTLAANRVAAQVLVSDCAQAVRDRRFDVVVCNPPFHQGVGVTYDTARQMVRDAAAVLRRGGRLYLVSNAFIRYTAEMEGLFRRVTEVFNDRRYRVVRAVR